MNRHTFTFSKEKYLVCSGISFPTLYQVHLELQPDDHDDALDEAESRSGQCCKISGNRNIHINVVDNYTQCHAKTATTLISQITNKSEAENFNTTGLQKFINRFILKHMTIGKIIVKNKGPDLLS